MTLRLRRLPVPVRPVGRLGAWRARAGAVALVAGALVARPAAAQDAARLARADSLWAAGQVDSAAAIYRTVLGATPTARPDLVLRVANAFAWSQRTDSALAWYAHYARLAPGDAQGPVGRARTLAWAARRAEALVVLDSVVRAAPAERDAVLLRAQVQAWAGDLGQAADSYRAWLATHADDDEARAGLARTLSWDGRFEDAATEYKRLEARAPAEAAKGIARVTAWRGDLAAAQAQWSDVTRRFPQDPEGWTGLAQVERWQGRTREADAALARALAVSPGYADAVEQRAWVRADLATAGDVLVATNTDSDKNSGLTVSATSLFTPAWQGRVSVQGVWRRTTLGVTDGSTFGLRAATTWRPDGTAWSVRAELGIAKLWPESGTAACAGSGCVLPARSTADVQVAYAVRVGGPIAAGITAGLGVSGAPFDETATLIQNRIRTDGVDADATVTLPGKFSMAGTLGWARVANGTVRNSRVMVTGQVRYALARASWVGVNGRLTAYDTTAFTDGYFAPQRFGLAELALHGELPRELGWNVIGEAGLGVQVIRVIGGAPSNQPAQRAQAGVVYRPVPGTEAALTLWIANVASPFSGTTDYRAGGLTVRGRLVF
jgi:tetratricopeptide (TPR) repeat protein